MFSTIVKIRVRYAETDQMGVVYHGHYITYYEVARVEAMRSIGISYKDMEQNGIFMPVIKSTSEYHLPAKYDEELSIHVRIEQIPKVRIIFNYDIYNEENKLIHQGETLLCFINKKTGRPQRAPKVIEEALGPFFQS